MNNKIKYIKRIVNFISWVFIGVVIMIVVTCFYKLNQITGYTDDDFIYHFVYKGSWPTTQLEHINNVFDLIRSIKTHTEIWNGRFVAHTLVQIFMQFPKSVFNIANTCVFILIGIQINLLVYRKLRDLNPMFLLATYCAMFYFLPDFGRAALWLSGSFNYLWMSVLYLLFLWPLRWQYVPQNETLFTIYMMTLGFLVGATNENIAPVFLLIAYAYYWLTDKNEIKKYIYPSVFTLLIGFALLITHNGGQAASQEGEAFQIKKIISQFIAYDGILFILCLITILILIVNLKKKGGVKDSLISMSIFILAALTSIGALILSPQVPPRTFFGSVIFLIAASLIGCKQLIKLAKINWGIGLVITCLISIVAFQRYNDIYPRLLANFERFYTAEMIIKEDKRKGQQDAFVPGMNRDLSEYSAYNQTAYLEGGDDHDPSGLWENTWMAKYYGIKRIYIDNTVKLKKVPQQIAQKPWIIKKIDQIK